MARTASLSFRVPEEKIDRLDALAAATDRPRSWLLEQALDSYLETQAWQVEHIRQGIDDLEAGRTVPHETVVEKLKQWGAKKRGRR